jgi:DNA-binding transcriptional regulator YiaG
MSRSTDFAVLVHKIREHLGLTQEQFAQEVGVSFSTVNVWENGKRVPLPFLRRRLLVIADEVGLPTEPKMRSRHRRGGQ